MLTWEKFEIRISQYNKPHIQIRSFDCCFNLVI